MNFVVKSCIKKIPILKIIAVLFRTSTHFFLFRPIAFVQSFSWYFSDYLEFRSLTKNNYAKLKAKNIYPCLLDKTELTPLDPVYFYQDTWTAKKIFELKPKHHYDIGSSAKTIGILSQFVPVTMIDIRPLPLSLPNLHFIKGSITALPFEDNSLDSISSLCVVEHIGLGRFGDELDPFGSEKAISELKRVVKWGGVMLFSVPVDSENRVCFNAHRTFTRDYLLKLFEGFEIIEEKYIYGQTLFDSYDKSKGFGTGLYHLMKGNNK